MNSFVRLSLTAAASVFAVSAAHADTTVVNSTPTVGWHYGTDNDYSPANTLVLTATDGTQLYGRWHVPKVDAVASDANGVYSFALGTSSISFDFGFTAPSATAYAADLAGASFTLKDLGTSTTVTWPVSFFSGDPSAYTGANSYQNSEQAKFLFLLGADYDPNRNDTYQLTLTAGGHTINYFAQVGAGAPAVPEPATWGMMIAGFGLVGGALRRRKASVAFA